MTGDSGDRDWPSDADTERDDGSDADRSEGYGVARDRDDDSQSADRPTVDLQDDRGRTATDPHRDPGPGGDGDPTGSPTPDQGTTRIWTALMAALAVISLGSAGTIVVAHDVPMASAGAVVLAFGFGAIAIAGRTGAPAVFGYLDDAWAEHRLYVWFSAGLFGVGIAFGALLYAAGIDLSELFLELIQEEFGEDELPGNGGELADEAQFEVTASFFILNNTPPFLAAIAGALTLGLVTVVIMLFNGVIVGNVAAVTGAEAGYGVVIALLAPHGIFELPALFIAAGVGFRFLHRVGQRLAGTRNALFTTAYLLRTTAFVVFGWLLLVLAAFVEAYVTFLIAETLFAV
ncbi:stage II sporulation protein M [Natronolimnohabitans sp. A-GB9]|uniref:stage II sporulation protein M n=1 Tax=Natronolimnohabitans sp. A-GB9 TaxID=3069757 RepID=UPI0027AEE3DB|nr:stage II sporulation protein M [Natronolimnohabitans sp. A-GB9]MDQ2051834.1 stage II sporulation protein M [Natronolimnohabitans sp. A-GB9]